MDKLSCYCIGSDYTIDEWAYPIGHGDDIQFNMPQLAYAVKITAAGSNCLQAEVYDENNKLISKEAPSSQSSTYSAQATSDKGVDVNKILCGQVNQYNIQNVKALIGK